MRPLPVLLALLALTVTGQAAPVSAKNGAIFVGDRQITTGGRDADPVLSPNGRIVVFTRNVPGKPLTDCAATLDKVTPAELWSVGIDGRGAHRLLALTANKELKATLCAFESVQFSPDGKRLYFESPAWATSDAIHVVDLTTGRARFFLPGNSLTVLKSCHYAGYQGDLIISQHRYFVFSGSYDWSYLFSPQGKEIGPLGDGDYSDDLEDTCG